MHEHTTTSVTPTPAGRCARIVPARDTTFELDESDRSYVFAVAMKYVKDEDAAADVTQEALLLAHRHRDSFRGDSKLTTWLYRIAATTSLMYLRKKRRRSREVLVALRPGDDGPAPLLDATDPGPDPERQSAACEAVAIAAERLDELGDKYRDIFRMRFCDGYTETEIARRLNLKVATVKTRAYRARLALREALTERLAA